MDERGELTAPLRGICCCGGRTTGRAHRGARGERLLHAGVDEVGRGPIAGPVVAAAVVFAPGGLPGGLRDSKQLTARRREALDARIREQALAFSVAQAFVEEIDGINVLQASLLAMTRALRALPPVPAPLHVQVDGRELPAVPAGVRSAEALIGGDACVPVISAASILAKVWRDRHMAALHMRHPQYGFDRHKGYATREHLDALRRHGPCPAHRRSFAPVAAAQAVAVEASTAPAAAPAAGAPAAAR